MDDRSIYQFSVEKLNGDIVSLANYKDKVLLIVNTASECGFTPQLTDLEDLRKDMQGKDFEILAFPSNDFGGQEPLEGKSIEAFCEVNHNAHYSIFNKLRVRGEYAHPLFKFFSQQKAKWACKYQTKVELSQIPG